MVTLIQNFRSLKSCRNISILAALLLSLLFPAISYAQEQTVDHFYDGELASKHWKMGMELEQSGNYLKAIEEYSKMGKVAIDGGKDSVMAMSAVNDLIGKFLAIEARCFSMGDAKTAAEASKQQLKLIEYKDGKNSQAYKTAALKISQYESTK